MPAWSNCKQTGRLDHQSVNSLMYGAPHWEHPFYSVVKFSSLVLPNLLLPLFCILSWKAGLSTNLVISYLWRAPPGAAGLCNFLFSSVRFTSLVFIGKISISGFFSQPSPLSAGHSSKSLLVSAHISSFREREPWARIFKHLRSPRIDSKEPIPPGYKDWRAVTTTLFLLGSQPP